MPCIPVHQQWKLAFQVTLVLKNPAAKYAGDMRDAGLIPGVGKIPWRRAQKPIPVCLPAESHRQKNLAGFNPVDHNQLDTTEAT